LQNVINNMGIKAEEIRQAKKFLENQKLSIKKVKPRLFAIVAKELNLKFSEIIERFEKAVNGKTTSSDKKSN